jgi:RNA polymerase sigma-70 factor, ECF subfamily
MSGEVTLALPLARLTTETCEATILYSELRKPLLRYLICLGLTTDDAQDVVQDAFVSLHRHLSAAGSQQNIRSWLFRVAHNAACNRHSSYRQRCSEPLDAKVAASVIDEATPERAVLEKERFRRLESAVRRLSHAERQCLLLRAGGLRYREIGEVLGMPTSTVGDTVERAIKKLAEKCNV